MAVAAALSRGFPVPVGTDNPLSFDRREGLADYLASLGYRDGTLWRAMRRANTITTLSSVMPARRERLIHAKQLTTLLTVLIDDVADRTRDLDTFRSLALLLQRTDDTVVSPAGTWNEVALASLAWGTAVDILREGPRYDEFVDLWLFDLAEMVQCQRWNLLANRQACLANTAEYLAYGTHNFNVKPHMTMDLMFSPDFRDEDLGPFRAAQHHAQVAVQLINDRYTLTREMRVEDSLASFPILWALEQRWHGASGTRLPEDVVRSLSFGVLEDLKRLHLRRAREALEGVRSFDGDRWIASLAEVERMYAESDGRL